MPEPAGKSKPLHKRDMLTITARHQAYLIDKSHLSSVDSNDPNIILTDLRTEDWNSSNLVGIKNMSSVESFRELSVAKNAPIRTSRDVWTTTYECFCLWCRTKWFEN